MALPSAQLVKAAVETIYSAFANDKTAVGSRQGVEALSKLANKLNVQYPTPVDIASGDDTYLGVSEMIAGEAAAAVGVVFVKSDATVAWDVADGKFLTAKGPALAANDIFVFSGSDDVAYLGTNDQRIAFDFSGETVADFVSIGS